MDDLDRWTRVMPLGSGAFGEVHLAWDREDERWVALKRFTGQDELGLLRMVIESRIRVSHPHLVRTLAFRLVDDRAWLVTEFARGGSLRALTARVGVLPWGWVAEAVDQILAALTALHATGVVHRDLKPANLLLRSSGTEPPHLLVADFGIATWRTVSMTGIGAAIGTPGYLAPEYLDGHQPSPATDVFAVGVLAAELLTARRLVHYSNASPTIPSSWHDVLPVPPEVPRPFAAVLQRMADPNPSRRYTDSTQAREALLSAAPPASRGDLSVLAVPDLLAALPPGWTAEGPEQPATTSLATPEPSLTQPAADSPVEPAPQPHQTDQPNLTGLLIDGGPTGLVPENEATLASGNAPLATPAPAPGSGSPSNSPRDSATPPAVPAADSAAHPPTPPNGTFPVTPASGLSTQPPTSSPTPPTTHSSGSPTHPPTPPTALPSGPSTHPPTSPATPPTTHPTSSPTHPPTPSTTSSTGSSTFPATPASGLSTQPPTGSPTSSTGPSTHRRTKSLTGSSTSPDTTRKARRRRKVKRTFLLLVLLTLVSGAGTLWWAATHRTIPGQPAAIGQSSTGEPSTPWQPEVLESCNRVEVGQERANGTERCQRTKDTNPTQHWVKAPPTGFPTSNPKGPFPGETCVNGGDTDYSPTGDRLTCDGRTWQVRT